MSTTFPPRERGRHGWAGHEGARASLPDLSSPLAGSALPAVSDGPRCRASGVGCSASGVHGVLCVPVVRLAGVGVDLR